MFAYKFDGRIRCEISHLRPYLMHPFYENLSEWGAVRLWLTKYSVKIISFADVYIE